MLTRLRVAVSRVFALFAGRRLDQDFDRELAIHLSMLAEKFVRDGMSPDDAMCAARRQFGGITQVKLERIENRGIPPVERLLQDVLYALRAMRKNPAFAVTVVLTLALGIGGNAAMFTVIHAV